MSPVKPRLRASLDHAPRGARVAARACAIVLAAGVGACGTPPPANDAQASASAESAEVSIRFDVSAGKPATVEVMAFRATTLMASGPSGPATWQPDVLGLVD